MTNRDDDATGRPPDERLADHAAIDRLARDLLPALVAKLGVSGLGELDIREDAWRVRLRMPADGRGARRSGGVSSRGQGRADSPAGPGQSARAQQAAHPSGGAARRADGADPGASRPADSPARAAALSPAVGFFRPGADQAPGAPVRAGDRLGTIDVLGVPHELVAPTDGIMGTWLVEPGEPVEYGQEVVEIELLAAPDAERGEDG